MRRSLALLTVCAGVLCLSACDPTPATPPKPKLILPVPAEPGPIAAAPRASSPLSGPAGRALPGGSSGNPIGALS
jgi:hypothetical protein